MDCSANQYCDYFSSCQGCELCEINNDAMMGSCALTHCPSAEPESGGGGAVVIVIIVVVLICAGGGTAAFLLSRRNKVGPTPTTMVIQQSPSAAQYKAPAPLASTPTLGTAPAATLP